ncbi:MAG: hypothetical protein LBR53_11440 [Deltaproteobacteria bacterium]|nr:hypothetical protein [Deltaproteobacteria bacterium]
MKKFFLTALCSLLFCSGALHAAAAGTTAEERKKYVDSLTADELYELHVDRSMAYLLSANPGNGYSDRDRFIVKQCLNSVVRSRFSEREMRELFVKPAGMDEAYYSRKLDQASKDSLACVEEALNVNPEDEK